MNDEVWDSFKYPIKFQGKVEGREEWDTFFEADNANDVKWRLRSYGYNHDYTEVRFVTADGQEFRHTAEEIQRKSQVISQMTEQKLAPLKAFMKSAPEDAIQTASEIMKAAEMSQHFIINRNSCVVIEHSALHRIEFHEFEDAVVCKIYSAPYQQLTETAVTIWKILNPQVIAERAAQGMPDDAPPFGFSPQSVDHRIKAFLTLLCSSIVRDFWVLNEVSRREKYQQRTEKKRERQGKGKDRKLVVQKNYTFLPRFRYNLDVYQDKPSTKVTETVRVNLSPAHVSGHIRRLPEGWSASDEAIENANEFGIIKMEEGTTFVKPHDRGAISQLRAYRSHSAMQLLFE